MQPAAYPQSDAPILPDTDRIVGRSKLLGAMRDLIPQKHYSIRTEQRLGILASVSTTGKASSATESKPPVESGGHDTSSGSFRI
jgi:hypothetical protein